ncbi:MAG TPA: OsmC family protein [Gammaproteobacteria bacterium]|nr:OsmC family protein [Gammaproteobacteria bacterium]
MSKFKEIFLHKQDLLRNRPDKCRVETKADSHLVEDFRSHARTRDFNVVLDQPENMGSSNLGPRPSELLLAALAACHEVTYRLYADAMDIDLQDIAVSVTGVSDARGFFNVDDAVAAGFSEVYGEINIVSNASDDEIERLRQAVNRHCPVLDDLRKPLKVELDLKRRDSVTDSAFRDPA